MSLAVAEDLDLLQIISFQGVDIQERRIVRVVGKFFPGMCSVLRFTLNYAVGDANSSGGGGRVSLQSARWNSLQS